MEVDNDDNVVDIIIVWLCITKKMPVGMLFFLACVAGAKRGGGGGGRKGKGKGAPALRAYVFA